MAFKVAVIYFSRRGRLVTLANVIAEGARQVEGAQVNVYRIRDPVGGDDPSLYDDGVLEAPVITPDMLIDFDCILIGAPGRQGGICAECRYFLDALADFQSANNGSSYGLLKGKVGGCFTSVGGVGRGYGGHEVILQSVMATFLQHGMVAVGVPPSPIMEHATMASPFGTCMAGKARSSATQALSLSEAEVKLAYTQGEWAARVASRLHGISI